MANYDYRLRGVYKDLTAQERAALALRTWLRGEPFDDNLKWSMPEGQWAEVERLVRQCFAANLDVQEDLAMLKQGIVESEVMLFWLESVLAWEERAAQLVGYLEGECGVVVRDAPSRKGGARELVLGAPPICRWTVGLGLSELPGSRVPDGDEAPPTLTELPEALICAVRLGIECHWQEQRAIEVVFDELAEEYGGEPVEHPAVAAAVQECKAKLEEMHQALLRWSEPFALPEPDESALLIARERVFPEQREARLMREAAERPGDAPAGLLSATTSRRSQGRSASSQTCGPSPLPCRTWTSARATPRGRSA